MDFTQNTQLYPSYSIKYLINITPELIFSVLVSKAILTCERMLLLVVVEGQAPDVRLVGFAAVGLEAHAQHGQRVAQQRLLRPLRLHEVVAAGVFKRSCFLDNHVTGKTFTSN